MLRWSTAPSRHTVGLGRAKKRATSTLFFHLLFLHCLFLTTQVMFENDPTINSSGLVAVDSVTYAIVSLPPGCPLAPQHAKPPDDDVISSLSTSSTQRLSGDISMVSESADHTTATTTTFLQSTTSCAVDVTEISQLTSSLHTLNENSNSNRKLYIYLDSFTSTQNN